MPPISAVIITYNEARNIARCIESLLSVADEIVVVDSFSSDQTPKICAAYPLRFLQHPFEGHIEQKNYAMQAATFDYILSLDADEALDDRLRHSILLAKQNWPSDAYSMNRLTNYCGQWIRHCGWYPDRKVRLFDRRKARWGGTNPHDKITTDAGVAVTQLEGDLLHYSYYTVEEHRSRARKYADIAANAMLAQQQRVFWPHVLINPVFKFIRNYLFKLGFLDGYYGFIICKISAQETWWKYRNALHRRSNAMNRFLLFALLCCTACGSSKPAPARRYGPPPTPVTAAKPPSNSVPATGMEPRPTIPATAAGINWLNSERLIPVLEEAQQLKKVVFVEFHAVWCAPCKIMEEETFTQRPVYELLNTHYLNFRTDYDSEAGRTIAEIYQVSQLPTVLFLNDQGVVLERHTGIVTFAELQRLHAAVQAKQ